MITKSFLLVINTSVNHQNVKYELKNIGYLHIIIICKCGKRNCRLDITKPDFIILTLAFISHY